MNNVKPGAFAFANAAELNTKGARRTLQPAASRRSMYCMNFACKQSENVMQCRTL